MRTMLTDIVKTVAVVVPALVLVHSNGAKAATVVGASMSPTLNPQAGTVQKPPLPGVAQLEPATSSSAPVPSNDVVLLNVFAAKHGSLGRGDVVTLISPDNPHVELVKRVVALPGDVVATRSYKRRYVRVPKGHCWLEGDNPLASQDSNMFGPVPLGLVTGRVELIWR
ncbi:inner membrane protease subunit 2 [Thecamonas trahens ATCC 50062]|uniref:Mitochondrial inner membrane protease subunit 2 n=1 Tax=Thecamonas trahens ATCC 50062 TaxID=461836 RepID=A0A0L0D353_THETB|nr:inner membrane protease subunit 2 [Thecamonas trahens ATCC 50062]KNC46601.1 inner membrane protease subunit 2 [Thecamonas trahens ATCC 50062]|eukprot:XP_013760376.1 inner membrane protease subunit 2 [Thecamonas trahens ATCC 50062]